MPCHGESESNDARPSDIRISPPFNLPTRDGCHTTVVFSHIVQDRMWPVPSNQEPCHLGKRVAVSRPSPPRMQRWGPPIYFEGGHDGIIDPSHGIEYR